MNRISLHVARRRLCAGAAAGIGAVPTAAARAAEPHPGAAAAASAAADHQRAAGPGPAARRLPAGRLNTHSDRVTSCLHEGAGYGLKGSKLNAYARSCANAN